MSKRELQAIFLAILIASTLAIDIKDTLDKDQLIKSRVDIALRHSVGETELEKWGLFIGGVLVGSGVELSTNVEDDCVASIANMI